MDVKKARDDLQHIYNSRLHMKPKREWFATHMAWIRRNLLKSRPHTKDLFNAIMRREWNSQLGVSMGIGAHRSRNTFEWLIDKGHPLYTKMGAKIYNDRMKYEKKFDELVKQRKRRIEFLKNFIDNEDRKSHLKRKYPKDSRLLGFHFKKDQVEHARKKSKLTESQWEKQQLEMEKNHLMAILEDPMAREEFFNY